MGRGNSPFCLNCVIIPISRYLMRDFLCDNMDLTQDEKLQIVKKIYIDRIRRDKIKDEYGLNRDGLTEIEKEMFSMLYLYYINRGSESIK